MSVQELQKQIRELSSQELAELQAFMAQLEADQFDTRFEADVQAGKFDSLEQRLRERIARGDWKEL
jgi:ribosomal protein L29